MKPWIKRTLIGLGIAGVLLGGAAAMASRHFHHGPWTTEQVAQAKTRIVDRIAGKLALDESQKTRLVVLADRLVEQRTAMLDGDPHTALRGLVAGNSFDRAGAEALLMAKTEQLRSGGPAVIAAFGDFYDSLNPEQQAQVREFAERRHGRRRD